MMAPLPRSWNAEDVTEATQVAHALADSEAHYRLLART